MFELSPNGLRGLPRAIPVIAWMITIGARTSMADKHDYCWESFNVTCAPGEVIVMSTARYGRMKFGKCLERDYFVGCSADILSYMDRKCSGRRSCAIDIPDTELHKMQPCPKDLLVYLEADYMCVKVADDRDICRHHHHSISTSAGSPGYIANLVTAETGHGSSSCPWLITVRPGQRINVTLLDFAVAGNLGRTGSHVCVRYGNLRETTKGSTDVTICGGEKRERLVYMSEGNSLTVEVMNTNLLQERPYFILKYEAVGCPDLRAPPHGWIDRQGDRATVSCNNSADVWHLVCNVDIWIGTYHNCTTAEYISEGFSHATPTYPLGVFVAVTIGIALGVFSGLLLLSMVVCCQRKSGTGKCFGASSMEEETDAACGLEKAHILLSDKFYYDIVARDMGHGCHLTRSGAGESCTCGTTTLLLPPPSTTTTVEFDSAYLATKCARSNAVHSSREHSYESPRVKLKNQQELIQCEFETECRVPPQGEDVNCRDCDTEQMGTDRYT